MTEVPIAVGKRTKHLDVCAGCYFIWFDPREFEDLAKVAPKTPQAPALCEDEKEALALARLDAVKEQQEIERAYERSPDHWWHVIPALFGIPIEYNYTPLKHRPLVTWSLAAVIAAASIAAFSNLESAVTNWGLIPAEFERHFGLTFVTSFFLHGGIVHLIGNLYFLVVFGDNTEDVLGKARYLLLIAAAAIVGDIAHILSDPRAVVPCVGASGGISGILAYYCLRFPRASVGIILWFRWIRLPVGVMFALWVLLQVMTAYWRSAGFSRVAAFAHLGGAAVGVLFWCLTRRSFSRAHRSCARVPQ